VASTIKLKISVDDSGSLKVVAKEAGKAASATDKLANSTDKLNNKRNKYHKTEKGVAGATSNSTKSFAKQAQAIGGGSSGLVGAYATLAAHVFAVSAAFGVLQRNAGFKQLEQGIIFTGRAAGANLPLVSKNLKEITDSAISTADAMKAVAIGTSAGFSSDQLEGLTKVAKGASLALGRDMTDAMDRLVRGAAKLEPEILDELGIMVRLDKTAQDFAGTIGKSADELTVFEKRMAFTNAIIDQGQKKFGALNGVIEANPYSKLAAQFDSLIKGTIGAFDTILGPAVGAIAGSMGMLVGVMGIFATGVVKMMVPALSQGGAAAADMADQMQKNAKSQIANTKAFKDAPEIFTKLQKKMADGTATAKDMTDAQTSLKRSIAGHNNTMDASIKKHGEDSKVVKDKQERLKGSENALKSLTNAQKLETQATIQAGRADVLNTASTKGLVATYKALSTQISVEMALLKADTIGKTTATKVTKQFSFATRMAAFSVKAFGLAIINAIPIIGQIIFFASMAIELFKKMFTSKPTVLEEQMEKTKEVLKEFPNVINQMIDSYEMASDSSQRFEISLKAQAGLISQVSSEMRAQTAVQRTALLIEQARARAALIKTKIINEKISTKRIGGGTDINAVRYKAASQAGAEKRVQNANEDTVDLDLAKDNQIVIMAEAITMQQMMAAATKAGSNENKLANKQLEETTRIFELLVNGGMGPDEAGKAYQKLELEVGNTLETFKASTDLVAASNKRMLEAAKPTGVYSGEITELGTVISALTDEMDNPEVVARYAQIFQNFGIKEGDLESLRTLKKELKELNHLATNAGVQASGEKLQAFGDEKAGGTTKELLGKERSRSVDRMDIAQRNLDVGIQTGMTDSEKAGYNTTINNELLNQGKIDSQLSADRVSEATRLGGAGFGAGTQVGETVQNIKGTLDNPEVEKSAKIKMMSDAISPMTEQLKSMGPEGEAMGMAIEGAALLGETLTSAFEGGKMSAKDGLAATAAALSAVSGIMKAQTKMRVAGIDKEIKAEKARDGKSKESLDKIKKLEKKKDDMKRKSFEKQKKMQIAQTVISTVSAVMAVMDDVPTPFNFILAGLVGAMGAMQIATIRKQTYDGGGGGGGASPAKKPSSVSMGERGGSVDLANSSSGAVGELGYARGKDGVGGINNFKPAFTGARYRASGGSAGYIVGEQGPELFMPDTPGNIVSAGDTAAGGGSSNVNISISAIDAAGVEDVLQAQRANIIGMIRESANQVGETFLENVDTISEGARY